MKNKKICVLTLYVIPENQKHTHREKNNGKIQNKQIVHTIKKKRKKKKNELNENRFYLRTKILIKIKIIDEKRLKKKLWGAIFQVAIFLWRNFPGGNFPGGIFPRNLTGKKNLAGKFKYTR